MAEAIQVDESILLEAGRKRTGPRFIRTARHACWFVLAGQGVRKETIQQYFGVGRRGFYVGIERFKELLDVRDKESLELLKIKS